MLVEVGSGTINDLCKPAAAEASLPYMVFATAPSITLPIIWPSIDWPVCKLRPNMEKIKDLYRRWEADRISKAA